MISTIAVFGESKLALGFRRFPDRRRACCRFPSPRCVPRTEYSDCAVFLMLDRDTQRVYRLLDFTKRICLLPDKVYAWQARSTVRIRFIW